jgi:general secretion pathway protein C
VRDSDIPYKQTADGEHQPAGPVKAVGRALNAPHQGAEQTDGEGLPSISDQQIDVGSGLGLTGVVATDDHQLGYAIIRSPDQQEFPFNTGDSIYGLAILVEIHIDHVIILRDGQHEVLRLPIEFRARDHALQQIRKQEVRRIVTDFRQKLLARDGMALIRMFGFEETYRNGAFIGFTVKIAGEDGARMLEELGVEEGDVITAVNGKRFAESLEAIESLSTLKDATEVDVEIDRLGVPMFFHFDFDQIEQNPTNTGNGENAELAATDSQSVSP